MESAIQKLPPAERDRLQAAREIAKQAPAVQSAEAAMKSTQTPEERREAAKNFQKAMRDAMLTADPSLADVLDKIKPPKAEPAPAASTEMAP
jgi:urease accessory protein UreF